MGNTKKVVKKRNHKSTVNISAKKRPKSSMSLNVAHLTEGTAPEMTDTSGFTSSAQGMLPANSGSPSSETMEGHAGIYSISTQNLLKYNIIRHNSATDGVKKRVTSRNGIKIACVVPDNARNHPGRLADKIVSNAVTCGMLSKAIQQLIIACTEEKNSPARTRRMATILAALSAGAGVLAERAPMQPVQVATLIKPIQLTLGDRQYRGLSKSTLFPLLTGVLSGKPAVQHVPKAARKPLHGCEDLLEATTKYLQLRYTEKALHELRYKHILPKSHQQALLPPKEYARLRKAYRDAHSSTTKVSIAGQGESDDEDTVPVFDTNEVDDKDDRFPVFRLTVVHLQALWTIEQEDVITAWQTQSRDSSEEYNVVVMDSDAVTRAALSEYHESNESTNAAADGARVAMQIHTSTEERTVEELHDCAPSCGVDDEASMEDAMEELTEAMERMFGPDDALGEDDLDVKCMETEALREEASQHITETLRASHSNMFAGSFGLGGAELQLGPGILPGTGVHQDVTSPRCIVSRATVLRCLHAWGYKNISSKATILDDAHERPDIVVDRELFVEKLLLEQHRIIKVYSPENWILIRDRKAGEPFSRLEQAALNVDLRNGELPILLVYHDESAFSANRKDASCWRRADEQYKTDETPEKGTGPGVMVSAFVSGFGTHSVRLLRSGKHFGHWNLDRMLDHTKEAMRVLKQEVPALCPLVLFDNSSRHRGFAEDALQASKMNKSDGGKPLPRRKTYWPLDAHGNALPGAVECSMKVDQKGKEVAMGLVSFVTLRSGYSRDEKGKFYSSYTLEQLRSMVDSYADFKHAQPAIIEAVRDYGGIAGFLPRFHCELNPCELLWAHVKSLVSPLGDGTAPTLVRHIIRHLYPPIVVCAQWVKRTSTYLLAYAIGLPGTLAFPWVRAITGHGGNALNKHHRRPLSIPLTSNDAAEALPEETVGLPPPPQFCKEFSTAIAPTQGDAWQRSALARAAILSCLDEFDGWPHAKAAVKLWLDGAKRTMLHLVEPSDPTLKPHAAPSEVLMPPVPKHHAIAYMPPDNLQQWVTSGDTFVFSPKDWSTFQHRRTVSLHEQLAEIPKQIVADTGFHGQITVWGARGDIVAAGKKDPKIAPKDVVARRSSLTAASQRVPASSSDVSELASARCDEGESLVGSVAVAQLRSQISSAPMQSAAAPLARTKASLVLSSSSASAAKGAAQRPALPGNVPAAK